MFWRARSSDGRAAYSPRWLTQRFLEPQPRSSSTGLRSDLDLVGDRADDRDSEPSLREPGGVGARVGRVEALAVVGHLDHETIGEQLEDDLDHAGVLFTVGVPDRIGRRLGERKLEIGDELVRKGAQPRNPGQGK